MNLEESDAYKEELERNSRNKRMVMLSIIGCIVLMMILIALIVYITYKDSVTLKLFVDKNRCSIPSDFYYTDENGKKYVSVKDLAELLGYEYTKGIYKEANENPDSGYFKNDFETVSIISNEKEFTKYITIESKAQINDIKVTAKSKEGYSETFKMEEPIKYDSEKQKIYVSEDYIEKMFNITVDWQQFRINFYTLAYNINKVQANVTKAGYTDISGYYENFRAMIDGYVIVGNGSNLYGVYSLKDNKEIISMKYSDIKYIQNTEEFYVVAEDNTVGLMDNSGKFIIEAGEFDDISVLDAENLLYLVEKNNEFGVLNREGKTIIYTENDEIGYDISNYTSEKKYNSSVWFGKCIPVRKDEKYGLYSIDGENKLLIPEETPLSYDGFGCLSTSKSKTSGNEQSVLFIPGSVGIHGIVIKLNDLYGIYDVNEEKIILTCVCTKIYSITKSGKTTYYFEHAGNQVDIEEYLEENDLKNIDSNDKYIYAPDYEGTISEDDDSDNVENDYLNTENNTTNNNTNIVNNTNTNVNNTNLVNNTNANNNTNIVNNTNTNVVNKNTNTQNTINQNAVQNEIVEE